MALLPAVLLVLATNTIPGFDRMLLPMHNGDAAGAAGSHWRVEEVIFNQGDEPASFYPHFFLASWFEPTVWDLPPGKTLPPKEIDEPQGCRACPPPPHPGGILYVRSSHRGRFVLYQRIYEQNVDHDNHGAIVPGVHESDFRRGRTTFPFIPAGANFRGTLRIYNLSDEAQSIGVRIVREDAVISETAVTVAKAYGEPVYGPYKVPLRPGYAQLPIVATDGPLRVIVEGRADYWAFVSVTSNSAQRVTVFVP